MGELLAEYGGWIVGLLTVIGTFIYNNRKVQVDESAMVLGQWKSLVENHQAQIAGLTKEILDLRNEVSDLRKRVRELEEENAGLKRAIAQNSQSTVFALERGRKRARAGEQATDKLRDDVEFNEHLAKLDRIGGNSEKKGEDE